MGIQEGNPSKLLNELSIKERQTVITGFFFFLHLHVQRPYITCLSSAALVVELT